MRLTKLCRQGRKQQRTNQHQTVQQRTTRMGTSLNEFDKMIYYDSCLIGFTVVRLAIDLLYNYWKQKELGTRNTIWNLIFGIPFGICACLISILYVFSLNTFYILN